MRRALQLDPLSFFVNRRLGATLYLAREYDTALAQLERAAEMERKPGSIDNYVSLIYEQKGNHDQAVQHDLAALHDDQPQLDIAALLAVYQQHGWQSYWHASTRAFVPNSASPYIDYDIGVDDLRVNQLDHAFDSFLRALDNHCFYMALIRLAGDTSEIEDVYNSERQILYVACTRARDRLLISSATTTSEFLRDMRT